LQSGILADALLVSSMPMGDGREGRQGIFTRPSPKRGTPDVSDFNPDNGQCYICLDTSILFRIVTQGQPGCETAFFQRLKTLVATGTVEFLLPEVIELELEKNCSRLIEAIIERKLEPVRKAIKDCNLWNELGQLPPRLNDAITSFKNEWLKESKGRHDEIHEFLNSNQTRKIPLTSTILLNAEKRRISGRAPQKAKRSRDEDFPTSDNDMCIIESLNEFFDKHSHCQFIFCTENTRDFATEKQGTKEWFFHSSLQHGLPSHHRLFPALKESVEFLEAGKPLIEPNEADLKLAEALEQESHFDNKSELELWQQLESLYDQHQNVTSRIRWERNTARRVQSSQPETFPFAATSIRRLHSLERLEATLNKAIQEVEARISKIES